MTVVCMPLSSGAGNLLRQSSPRAGPIMTCAPQLLDPGRTDPIAEPSLSCGVIALPRIVLRSFADLAGLVVPSATPLTRHRIDDRPGVRARSVLGGLHHEYLLVPALA